MKFVKWTVLFLALGARGLSAYSKASHMVEMRDGIRLDTDVYIPDTDDSPWPAVLIRTPYNKDNPDGEFVSLLTDQSGYGLVIQNTRGRFSSEGVDSVFLDDAWGDEKQDGYDAVEWVAEQTWCDGEVGMWGASANGITQYMAAGANPPHLKALFVMVGVPSLYHYVVFPGGEFRKYDIETWLFFQGASHMLSLFDNHPMYDYEWERINLAERWDSVNVACCHVAGWYDIFLEGGLDAFTNFQELGGEGARGNQKLLVGPWTHGTLGEDHAGDLVFPANAEIDLYEESIRWFDYWLKGIDNGVMDEPVVKYYQMGDPSNGVTEVENTWVEADTWPVEIEELKLYLAEDGLLDSLPPVVESAERHFDYNPLSPVPTVGGRNLFLPAGPKDQRGIEGVSGIIIYTSEELTKPVAVAGKIAAHLWASSDKLDTDWSVRISDVYPDGRSMLVGDGILRARYHSSAPLFDSEELLVPDSIYEFEVDLWSSAITFAQGHRIRVAVASSNYRRFEKNPNTGAVFARDDDVVETATNRIYCDADHPSYISLPVPVDDPVAVTEAADNLSALDLQVAEGNLNFIILNASPVTVSVYDTGGRKVADIFKGFLAEGNHTMSLPDMTPGVYFIRLSTPASTTTAKLLDMD